MTSPQFTPKTPLSPTPEAIVAARKSLGLSQTDAGRLIYRTLRNWAQWEGGERKMDPALWELFRLKTGLDRLKS